MGIRSDIRLGKPHSPDPDLPLPDSEVPVGCSRFRINARAWRIFRNPTAYELKGGRKLACTIDNEPDPDLRRVIDAEGARPSSLIAVHAPATRDPLHDLQLLGDRTLINERTIHALGPLHEGGLPAHPAHKPGHLRVHRSEPPLSTIQVNVAAEDEPMKLSQLAAAAALAATLAGCSDPDHPSRNPHPTQRYELTITADAPGAWDSVKAQVRYEVINWENCTPEAPVFIGGHIDIPIAQWEDVEVKRLDENTWRGYFYRDLFHDEDYHGLGICRWDGTQVAPRLFVHGMKFGGSQMVSGALKQAQVRFFRKTDFLDRSPSPYPAPDFDSEDPEVRQGNGFFPIAISVKEDKL